MAITRGMREKLLKYGSNLPTDKRTRSYQKFLRENNMIQEQYEVYLQSVIEDFNQKQKRIQNELKKQNERIRKQQEIRRKNKEIFEKATKLQRFFKTIKKKRFVGNTYLKLELIKGQKGDDDTSMLAYLFQDANDVDEKDTFVSKKRQNGNDIEIHNIAFDKYVFNKKETEKIVEKQVEFLTNKLQMRPYVIEVEILEQKSNIFEHMTAPLEQSRMRQSGNINIDGYDNQEWDKNNNQCVYDWIIHRYGNVKGFKKVCNKETITKVIGDESCLTEGINSLQLRQWCMKYDVPMSGFDDKEKRFIHFRPNKVNRNAPAMLYRISDNHFYPIPDSKVKSLITIATQSDAKSDVLYNHVKKESSNPIKNVVVLENTSPLEELSKIMREKNIKPTQINCNDGNIQSFKIKDTTYTINQFIPMTKELCNHMNIEYTGQTIGTILKEIIKETIEEIKVSHHNPAVFDSLVEAKKNRVHTGFIQNIDKNLLQHKNTIARDINKHYTSILYEPKEEWVRFDFNDSWKEYDGTLKLGLYYVKTNDTTLFRKTDIYSSSIIQKAIQEKIDFDILYQLLPTYQQPKNMFKLVIDKIIEYSKGKKGIYKFMINMMSGMLAKTKCKVGKYHINKDINQIFAFINEQPDMRPIINNIPETDYYLYGTQKDILLTENNLGMYIQILDQSNIKLYDMVKQMGGTLIARKVDCAVVYYDNEIKKLKDSDNWGEHRQCEIPTIKNTEDYKEKNYQFMVDQWYDLRYRNSDQWELIKNVLEQKGGLLLQSDAGCGKTYVAKMIAKNLDNVKCIAPTNKASLNLKGTTIHKFLNMDIDENISTAKLNYIKKNVQYIIVDEISMITKEIWRRLVFLKRSTNVKFLLLGDEKQLEPVEDEDKIDDYFNHSCVKFLCNNNRNILKVRKRYNPELAKILDDVENVDIKMFPKKESMVNIAYTHKTRIKVNEYWNNKLKQNKEYILIPKITKDKHSQDMYIYKDCPLIARQNDNKNKEYLNNETFNVVDFNDKYVILQNERPDDDGEPYIHNIKIDIQDLQKLFYLNYCSTIHKYQGTTIQGEFNIYDWNHPCMTKKAKYTALSRSTCIENIGIIGSYNTDDYNDKKINEKLKGYLDTDKQKGYDNDITLSKIKQLIEKQNGTCNICNCDLKYYYESNDRQQFSVDRIDSRKGHTCDNIQILCWGCNSSKGNRF